MSEYLARTSFIPVKAFMNVERDLVSILKKGSLMGYFCEPHKVVCSRMWDIPVPSMGVVRNPTLKRYRNTMHTQVIHKRNNCALL